MLNLKLILVLNTIASLLFLNTKRLNAFDKSSLTYLNIMHLNYFSFNSRKSCQIIVLQTTILSKRRSFLLFLSFKYFGMLFFFRTFRLCYKKTYRIKSIERFKPYRNSLLFNILCRNFVTALVKAEHCSLIGAVTQIPGI